MTIRFSGTFKQLQNVKHLTISNVPHDPFISNVVSVVNVTSNITNSTITSGFVDTTGNTYKAEAAGISIANAVTFGGNPVLSYTGASTGTYLFTPTNPTAFALTNQNFTYEGYYNLSSLFQISTNFAAYLMTMMPINGNSNTVNSFGFVLGGTSATNVTAIGVQTFNGSGTVVVNSSISVAGTGFALNQWTHFACSRQGSNLFHFINGILVGTTNIGTTSFTQPNNMAMCIGALPWTSFAYPFKGFIGGWRLTKGVCRYTANFTPPAAPFPTS